MKKEDQKREEPILGQGNIADDLPDWAGKIEALAEFLSAQAYHEARGGGSTQVLEGYGERFGAIIADYARAIEKTIEDHSGLLRDAREGIVIPMERLESASSYLKNTKRVEDLIAVNNYINEINSLIETVARPLMKMAAELKENKERICGSR